MIILNDFDTSVRKALSEIDPEYERYNGLVVCGTHQPENFEYMIEEIKKARESNTPFLGICAGMQLMAIEYAKDVLQYYDATSEEFGMGTYVVKKMPELRVGIHPAWVGDSISNESFWHNYKVDVDSFPELWDGFEIKEVNDVVTSMKLKGRDNFMGVQFHPEYQSSSDKPHPVLVKFIELCKK